MNVARLAVLAAVLWTSHASLNAQDLKQVVEKAKSATALVDLEIWGSGSSFCIDKSGLFITNHHVVRNAEVGGDVSLILNPGQPNEKKVTAKYLKFDDKHDLALLKVDAKEKLTPIAIGDDSNVTETDEVSVFGYPFGRMLAADRENYPSISVNTGRISALRRKDRELQLIQIDAAVNPGNSGGPVLNSAGQVIGVVVSGIPGSRVSFAIPSSLLKTFLATPAVTVKTPKLSYDMLDRAIAFQIDVVPLPGSTRLKSAKLFLDCDGVRSGPFAVRNPEVNSVVETKLDRDRTQPDQFHLQTTLGNRTQEFVVKNAKLKLNTTDVRLSEVRRFERRGEEFLVTFNSGKKRIGTLSGWENIVEEPAQKASAAAEAIDVYSVERQPQEIRYTLKLEGDRGQLPALEGTVPVEGVPTAIQSRGTIEDPFGANLERLHLTVQVEGKDKITIARRGLRIEHQEQAKPGIRDNRGRYLLVNGKRWYPEWNYSSSDSTDEDTSDVYPLKIGGAIWDFEVLKVTTANNPRHDGERGKVTATPDYAHLSLQIDDSGKGAGIYELLLTRSKFDLADEPEPSGPSVGGTWDFDDIRDNLVIPDRSGQKHDGLLVDAERFPEGPVGKGFQTTGGASLELVPLGTEGLEGPLSFAFWVRSDAPNNDAAPFSTVIKTGDSRGFECMLSEHRILVNLIHKFPGNVLRFHSLEKISRGEWTHVAVTYDGKKTSAGVAIYINGEPATIRVTHDSLSGSFHSDSPIRFGGRVSQHMFHGAIDELRLYKRILKADEVEVLAAADRDPPASLREGLFAHWSFDNVSGSQLPEETGQIASVDWTKLPPSLVIADDPQHGKVMHVNIQGRVDCGPIGNFERDQPFTIGGWVHSGERGLRAWRMAVASRTEHGRRARGVRAFVGVGARFKMQLIHNLATKNFIEVTTQKTLEADRWVYVVATYDGSSKASGIKLYVDAESVPVQVLNDKLDGTVRIDRHLFLGHCPSFDGSCDGILDNVFVLDRCLAPDEVAAGWRKSTSTGRNP